MVHKAYRLVYDVEFIPQLKAIAQKYHSTIKKAIEDHLIFEPDKKSTNRKPLTRATNWGARWELRCGEANEYRIFYSIYPELGEVHILAVGIKIRERLVINGKEVKL